ncbi:PAS domain-containing sensor histidine kinase [Rhodopseudomonas palustris]|uniref:PAS domain-containing sensor histidine kinase n=1 Tax=Rhodopseudomonas palustris TaxID=1076 RepID=UPI0020CDB84B|nr:PAS domain-containing sensor histidine kinase [Rhodopseudomonas palustris]MCP9627231.1 PAS domain-containing sensor histidine kinase [Rhodopseudomonas palustris]
MTSWDFQLRGVDDPRLAAHAIRAHPVWLWSADGTRVLWANPVAARLFGAENGKALAARRFGPADPHRRLVAQLAGRLPRNGATRLERLRGFGARLGALVTCGCASFECADGTPGVLIAAVDPVGPPMPLVDRLRGLVEGIDTPIAAFGRDGLFVGASESARTLLGFRNLSEAGLDQARAEALQNGRAETPVGVGRMVLQRVGSGRDIGLVALLEPNPPPVVEHEPDAAKPPTAPMPLALPPPAEPSPASSADTGEADVPPSPDVSAENLMADYEPLETLTEAPAEFSLLGEVTAAEQAETSSSPMLADETSPLPASDADVAAAAARGQPSPHAELASAELASAVASPPSDTPLSEPKTDAAEGGVAEPPQTKTCEFNTTGPETTVAESAEFEAVPQLPVTDAASAAPEPPTPEPEPVLPAPRRHPLRFVWQLDQADERFTIRSDEFLDLLGPHTAASFGQPWPEIRAALDLDPDDQFAQAVAQRHTWSGITLHWPADDTSLRLPVEMSGLPVQDRDGNLVGYRGFGVCRDLDGLDRLAMLRRHGGADEHPPRSLSADFTPRTSPSGPEGDQPAAPATSHYQDTDHIVEPPRNVLPFRPVHDARSPALTPVENNAFNELARQLAERLEAEAAAAERSLTQASNDDVPETSSDEAAPAEARTAEAAGDTPEQPSPTEPQADWLTPPAPPAVGDGTRDRVLVDLIPVGVMIYRLDRLLYANAAFLQRTGFTSLAALEEAGGLDALYVEEGASGPSSTSETGAPITVSSEHSAPATARLHTITWDGEQALALIFSADVSDAAPTAPDTFVSYLPSDAGQADAEELGAILDTTAEGILMFDADGRISACNRSAEALFGYDGAELVQQPLVDLFAPESSNAVRDYFASVRSGSAESLLDHGLEALGRVREGGLFPLTMTIGRTRPEGPNFFAVFRDLSQARRIETELNQVRKLAERAAGAKADVLARLSHEIRTPLNAIIGFAEVMIEERFGPLGNERYGDYLKDIRASGERVIGIVGDLLDLSQIETGKLELDFTSQSLNELVEQCVAVMQPRANRERIIIRTSLAHALPPVVADAQALRQILMHLIGTSIHLANPGGQVIVSTALSDFGEVVLRVRDTGHRLNDDELAAALQPFSTPAPSDRSEAAGVSLSLTKALVEANRAQFHIKSAPQSGTLIEVVFAHAPAGV